MDQDLNIVIEKLKTCRIYLREGKKIDHDEALNKIVGFLEACRDRMADLVEAGTFGLLTEDIFAKVLKVNDALIKTLEAELMGLVVESDDDLNTYRPSFSIEVSNYSYYDLYL